MGKPHFESVIGCDLDSLAKLKEMEDLFNVCRLCIEPKQTCVDIFEKRDDLTSYSELIKSVFLIEVKCDLLVVAVGFVYN